jgi:hypothetical protein
MRIAALIASTGRPGVLHDTLEGLLRQSRPPEVIMVSSIKPEDIDNRSRALPGCRFVTGARGLTCQLNLGLDQLPLGLDLVLVCDDDIELSHRYLEMVQQLFSSTHDLVAAAGTTLLDGATSPETVTRERAHAFVREFDLNIGAVSGVTADECEQVDNLYGCHAVFRIPPLLAERFDERLALYSLYFEADTCRRMAKRGRVLRTKRAGAVHLANKGGRMSGFRMGYSQVVNTHYLWRKGTVFSGEFFRMVPQAVCANALKTITGDAAVDRFGRLRGNLLGIIDVLLGRARPERVLEM